MRRLITVAALVLVFLIVPVSSVAACIEVVSRTGDGTWIGNIWYLNIFPGESKAAVIKLHNGSNYPLDVKVSVTPGSLDNGNLLFELDKTTFTMPGKSYAYVTLTVKASPSATPGTYTSALRIEGVSPLSVTTNDATYITSKSATLNGNLTNLGTASSVEVYFQYGITGVYGSETPHQILTCEPRIFMALVNNLLPDTAYHFRAVAVGDATSYGDDRVFRTLPQPVITVISPDGGERWAAGTRQTIRWTYANVNGDVKIELLKGGVLNRVIGYAATRGNNGTGSYSWSIPSNQVAGTDYKIRVTSIFKPECYDASNSNFTITKK